MIFYPVIVFIPTPCLDENGQPILDAQGQPEMELVKNEIEIVLERIKFAFKAPLNTNWVVGLQAGFVIHTQSEIPSHTMEEAGLVKFDTPDSGVAWVRPEEVQFITSPALGKYILSFDQGTKVGLQIPHTELVQKLGGDPNRRSLVL